MQELFIQINSFAEQLSIYLAQAVPNYMLLVLLPVLIVVFAMLSSAYADLCGALISSETPKRAAVNPELHMLSSKKEKEFYESWQKRIERGE